MLRRRGLISGVAAAAAIQSLIRPSPARAGQILFQQPSYADGIALNFSVRGVVPTYTPVGAFYLHSNQPNPYRSDNNFVPVLWDAGQMTGLHVGDHGRTYQRGIFVKKENPGRGHTCAQVYYGVVGAYMYSPDLFQGSPGNRMMITPGYQFPGNLTPFAGSNALVGVSFDLQVPVATDSHQNGLSNTYAKMDLLFISASTGARLSFSAGVFTNQGNPANGDSIGFDDLSLTSIIAAQVSDYGKLVTLRPGSATIQVAPWRGWKTFTFTISQAQFLKGLKTAAPIGKKYGYTLPIDPSDYVLTSTHLNAEMHFTAATPSTMGWSMQNYTLTQLA